MLDGLLNFGDVGLGFFEDLVVLDFAFLETVIMLGEDLFGLNRELRFFNLTRFLCFFELLSLLLGFLDV